MPRFSYATRSPPGARFGLRAVAQAMARELGPNALDNPDLLMPPSSVANAYWQLHKQPKSAWTFEMEIRPLREKW